MQLPKNSTAKASNQKASEEMTKFKIGQKVYDDVLFPGMEGEVVDIQESGDFPIVVRFDEHRKSYTEEGRLLERYRPTLFPFPYKFNPVEATVTHDEAEKYGQANFN